MKNDTLTKEVLNLTAYDLAQEPFLECTNLNELIQRIEIEQAKIGRVVCQFKLNGLKISEEDEGRMSNMPIDEILSLEIQVENPSVLVQEMVTTALELLQTLERSTDRLSELLAGTEETEYKKTFFKIIDDTSLLAECLSVVRHHFLNQFPDRRHLWFKEEEHLNGTLIDLLNAVQVQDQILTTEIIEYELANSLATWAELLKSLRE